MFGRWLLCATIAFALYLPWLVIFLNQTQRVSTDFWITPSPKYFIGSYALLLCPLHTLIPFLMVKAWRNIHLNRIPFTYLLGVLIPIGTIFVAIVLSLAMRPLLLPRYILPTGMCLLVFIFFIYSCATKRDKMIFVFCLLFSFFMAACTYIIKFANDYTQTHATGKFISKFASEDAIFIFPAETSMWHELSVLGCKTNKPIIIPPHQHFMIGPEREGKMFPNFIFFTDTSEMTDYIHNSGKTIYTIKKTSQKVNDILTPDNYTEDYIGTCVLRTPCNFYKLTPKTNDK